MLKWPGNARLSLNFQRAFLALETFFPGIYYNFPKPDIFVMRISNSDLLIEY